MTTVRAQVGHDDLIHDAQLDYYGLRLATCSSDRLVKVFDVVSENGNAPKVTFSCDLLGHAGPVWEVAWAHPRWGTLLASCSYDASVIVHRQNESGVWEEAYRFTAKGSVNAIEWCPYEYGLALACASSDGCVYILRSDATTGEWKVEVSFEADKVGCNSVTWAPYGALGSVSETGQWILRVATGGADSNIKIFKCDWDQVAPRWDTVPEVRLDNVHKEWIRDVAWAPSIGLPYNLLASCSEDGIVCVWSQEPKEGSTKPDWVAEILPAFKMPVWRVAWSVTGNLLAVSAGDSEVSLWKESLEEKKWMRVSDIKDKSSPAFPANEPKTLQEPNQLQRKMESAPEIQERKVDESNPIVEQDSLAEISTSHDGDLGERPKVAWEGAPGTDAQQHAVNNGDQPEAVLEQSEVYADQQQPDQYQQQYYEEPSQDPQHQQQQWYQEGGEWAPQGAGDQQQWQGNDQYAQWDPNQAAAYDQGAWEQQQQGWEQQQQQQQGWEQQQQAGYDQQQQQQSWDHQQYEDQSQQHWQAPADQQGYNPASQGWSPSNAAQPQQGWNTAPSNQGLQAPPVNAGQTFPPQNKPGGPPQQRW